MRRILKNIIAFVSGGRKTFDICLFVAAIAILILALLFFPKNNIKLITTEIVFQQWWEEKMPPGLLRELIDEFELLNSDVKVCLDTKTQAEIKNNLLTYIEDQKNPIPVDKKENKKNKSKKETVRLPDIVAFDPMWLDNLSIFENITDYFIQDYASDIIDEKSLLISSFINVLYYNITFLQNANFDRPPKTWQEFLKYARAIKEQDNFAYSLSSDYFNEIFPWLATSGFAVEQDFASSKPFITTLEFFSTLKNEQLFNYTGKPFSNDEKIAAFCSEKIPMIVAPSCEMARIKQINPKLNFSITSIPYSDEYPPKTVFFVTNKNIALLSSSKNKEASLKFMEFLLQKKQELFLYFHSYTDSGADVANELNGQQKIVKDPLYIKLKGMYKTEDSLASNDMNSMWHGQQKMSPCDKILTLYDLNCKMC
jgi:ABC-type glycerol-3-phosphate transport system substrate-binding protein